ncbi:hypothetical protein BBJ29_003584 [Phytophthora kernoviae]|nr:hypothetical protein BBJ29_003584 [Phytophthora kernoviae]
MSSVPTSTTSSGGNVSPRSSRMSSSSGSFSSQSLQGFRTVSLPGLFPGTHLGILASGLLDKRRDGAVRGGWAKRLFILSTRSLHYYRKVEESELFGKERGQVLLSDIGYSKLVTPEEAPAGTVEPGHSSYFVAVLSTFISATSGNLEELEKTPSEAPIDEVASPILSILTCSASGRWDSLSGAQDGKRLSPVMSPIDKIEVIEADQDKDQGLPATLSPGTASVDGSVDAESTDALVISGGPIAFSPRFVAGEKGDVEKGRQRYLHTLEWRKENNIDNILVTPHPNFEIIKKYYPQYFHGRTRDGLPVYYERPGKIDLPALKREGLSIDDLLRHYMYITEYLWRVVEPNDSGRSITVLDVTGIGMYDLGGEVLDFIKRASAFTGAHYPERSAHIFIINIPGWFNMIWRMVKPLIDPVTREKVHMLKGSAILRELETLIDLENIPSDFGGEGVALGDSTEEHTLAAHVNEHL